MEREGIVATSISVVVGLLLVMLWQTYSDSVPSALKTQLTSEDVVEAFKRDESQGGDALFHPVARA
jgi:hypothetical protein